MCYVVIGTYSITTLEKIIFTKEFASDIDSGYKDAAHIQNDLQYICVSTDFACWKISPSRYLPAQS